MQVIVPALLKDGFEAVERDNLMVTDDVSIIEAINKPVKLTKGSYSNMKVRFALHAPLRYSPCLRTGYDLLLLVHAAGDHARGHGGCRGLDLGAISVLAPHYIINPNR